jgi:hypothetical protein
MSPFPPIWSELMILTWASEFYPSGNAPLICADAESASGNETKHVHRIRPRILMRFMTVLPPKRRN